MPLLRVLPAEGRLPILSIGIGSGGQEGREGGGGGGGGGLTFIFMNKSMIL